MFLVYLERLRVHPPKVSVARFPSIAADARVLAGHIGHLWRKYITNGAGASQVDRAFLVEVFWIPTAPKFFGVVHHEQVRPKLIPNTDFTKGVSWPKKSIHSIRNCMVRYRQC
jgi:hypothetical protein